VVVVIVNGVPGAVTVIEKALVKVFAVGVAESVTFMEKLKVPAAVGVPEILPAVRDKPAGRVLPVASAQVYGAVPPVAFRVTGPYAVPVVPAASGDVVVMVNVVAFGTNCTLRVPVAVNCGVFKYSADVVYPVLLNVK